MSSSLSRLDRLLLLLDTGSSPAVRAAAARQIAQIAAKSVNKDVAADAGVEGQTSAVHIWHAPSSDWSQVMAVVAKILPYLHSKTFETRTAASNALCQICALVPKWSPSSPPTPDDNPPADEAPPFPPVSVSQLLTSAPLLLASSGKEFTKPATLRSAGDVAKARKEAMGRLGLGFLDGVGDELSGDLERELVLEDAPQTDVKMEEADLPKAESESPDISPETLNGTVKTESGASVEPAPSPVDPPDSLEGLSARERNRLKRKRKTGNAAVVNAVASSAPQPSKPANKVRVIEGENGPKAKPATSPTPSDTVAASDKVIIDPQKGGQVSAKEKAAVAELEVQDGQWIWARVVEVLEVSLLSENWEIRHGAAMALREIVKAQGTSGGMRDGLQPRENAINHEKWCNNLAVKCLLIFVLDRFSDFVSDQMVAPVRETVSQTMAALLLHMPRRSVLHVHGVLLDMIFQNSGHTNSGNGSQVINGKNHSAKLQGSNHVWQVRHSGLLGMKYEVAVRSDLVDAEEDGLEVLKGVMEAAMLGLGDQDDDVRCVAATCLTPIVNQLVERLPDEIPRVMTALWSCLADMKDDLGSSVSAVMDLLGKLVAIERVTQVLADPQSMLPLTELAPTLFPFFRHTIPSVRLAVVNTLLKFLSVPALADDWISQPFLRLLFQNLVVEERADIRAVTFQAWKLAFLSLIKTEGRLEATVMELLMNWFTILMNPLGTPIDRSTFFRPARTHGGHNVDKSIMAQDFSLVSQEWVLRGRVAAARAVAFTISVWPLSTQHAVFQHYLTFYDQSSSMLQRFLCATIVQEWAIAVDESSPQDPTSLVSSSPLAAELSARLITFIEAAPPPAYHEMTQDLSRLHNDCRSLLNAFATDAKLPQSKIPTIPIVLDLTGDNPSGFSLASASEAAGPTFDGLKALLGRTKKREVAALEERRMKVLHGVARYIEIKKLHDIRVMGAFAGAIVALRVFPEKLNPVIHGIMNGTKFEENVDLQERFAMAVVAFVAHSAPLHLAVRMNPAQKIVKNVCTFICADDTLTPVFADSLNMKLGIGSIKRPAPVPAAPKPVEGGAAMDLPASTNDENVTSAKIQRRGALMALANLGKRFGPNLFEHLPKLWECMNNGLLDAYGTPNTSAIEDVATGQAVIDNLTVIQGVAPHLHQSLLPRILGLFPLIVSALRSQFLVIRQTAARCFATLCDVFATDAMHFAIAEIVPLLGDSMSVTNRQGAMEVIAAIVQLLDLNTLPYVIFLIVPVLGRMSDPDDDVRYSATNTFASLVKMVPLEAGLPDPPGFSEEMLAKRAIERQFLTQLLDGSKVQPYQLPVTINAELRKYQQDGVNWLAFLAKYQLHGILCDDMGLGKTLQSICILASKHYERSEKYRDTKSPDSVHMPSLIVCPPTLTGHWYHEILKYANNLRPVMYCGPSRERSKLMASLTEYDVVITSYDVVRNDVSTLSKITWLYCILDEGHVIKNDKTKLTRAVKSMKADHRLILSGTPIQNNVLELWSLFDFLMPGFLGSESSFNERFGKPILANRDSKAGAKTAEAAAIALEALHKQVLPFLLRRLKEDVLSDLPPKIIQDYYCELSDIQKMLYDDFTQSQAAAAAHATVKQEGSTAGRGQQHVFQSLQYLRKLCNHPALVAKDPAAVQDIIDKHNITLGPQGLRDIQYAPKIQALRQLLVDCGIGTSISGENEQQELADTSAAISQHRVLIFCQMKQMIDMIETDLFQALMPTVTYMRLDGTVDANKRHAIVQTFNADPSIDCLLLTTQVGGLGLTLTGADTVIFVEHDWNPMKDLQAMDRAHRLGQKKVVNVYRLITKGTLEEKIMGLQRFKLNIANSVITQQNSGLSTMDTDLVLDLFKRTSDEEDAASKRKRKDAESTGAVSQKNVLEGLEELPAEDEYESLDLSAFMGTIGR